MQQNTLVDGIYTHPGKVVPSPVGLGGDRVTLDIGVDIVLVFLLIDAHRHEASSMVK